MLVLRLACQEAGVNFDLRCVSDGEKAIEYLAGTGMFTDRALHPAADLLLLDLNLPRENGFSVLEWLRRQPQFTSLPVVVYTSSVDAADCAKAYRLGANDYAVKLSNVQEIAGSARQIDRYWLRGLAG